MSLLYPQYNLFCSDEWQGRLKDLNLSAEPYRVVRKSGIQVAYRNQDYLVDFEKWPNEGFGNSEEFQFLAKQAHVVMFRKLLIDEKPADLPKGSLLWPSAVSPYMDLTSTLRPKKRAMDDIKRCERKLIQEHGSIEISIAKIEERLQWFENWIQMQETRRHSQGDLSLMSDSKIYQDFHLWIVQGAYPEWMKLFQLKLENTFLALGLCYVWRNVFYFQLPAFNQDQKFRKYGLGKLFVQKLIEWSLDQKLSVFDFLQGDEPYKFDWNPLVRPLFQCEVPLGVLGRVVTAVRSKTIQKKKVSVA